MDALTPMMRQYLDLKELAKDSLLLFRMGDFFEAFYEDATTLATICDLTLTKRGNIAMSGVPCQTIESVIDRLTAAGLSVAIADQMEKPNKKNTLLRREIVRIVTPGTTTSSQLLDAKKNHFLVALGQVGTTIGVAVLDLSTSEFQVTEFEDEKALFDELLRLEPAEILIQEKIKEKNESLLKEIKYFVKCIYTIKSSLYFEHRVCYQILKEHFQLQLDSLGMKAKVAAINAAGALLTYIKEDLKLPSEHIRTLKSYTREGILSIDQTARRHLELTESLTSDKKNAFFAFLDHTCTPMGARLLKQWLQQPSTSLHTIEARQEAVESLVFLPSKLNLLRQSLKGIKDILRLMMKVTSKWATPRELIQLRNSFEKLPEMRQILSFLSSNLHQVLASELADLGDLCALLKKALIEEPSKVGEGPVFQAGYSLELDALTNLSKNSAECLAIYQEELRQQTDAKSLKVSYNRVFGYYIEVSRKQAAYLDQGFIKKQTLANTERFTTEKLQLLETEILEAEEKKELLEKKLYEELLEKIAKRYDEIFQLAQTIAQIDALQSLAQASYLHQWTKPYLDLSYKLEIIEGRHPIVESKLEKNFIPNSTYLDEKEQIMVITGPNMAGKSTYIRQVALIVILAHMGSFVPAKSAHIGIIDQIFTRIGASDDLSRGQSTFMVEMCETSHILNHATDRSLVILDEVGRGTSTYDGLAIAISCIEYLIHTPKKNAKTLFATHYFELTELENRLDRVVNYHATMQELDEQITFLYSIVKGKATKSYGIFVAKLAQMPPQVVQRALEILEELEEKKSKQKCKKRPLHHQLLLFDH